MLAYEKCVIFSIHFKLNYTMRQLLFSFAALVFSMASYAQSKDPILGTWLNPSGEGKVEIYESNGKFFGKLYLVKDKSKKDAKNPDEKLRSRDLNGIVLLKDFSKKGDSYEDGEIYDPKSGKTYSCKMKLKDDGRLDIRGFVGIGMFGRTETWKRVK
ncbi:hypothetical protein M472_06285 [Sphingobacterium paucimobilis HER1398]|uniref:DUF2147 domain-containing protein n=2 Tax=Sphingobacterium TaxID=28453 RepID=U2HS82_9SPHI|nr:hypothetical protein M472_06285 [Sphingobacterium paucimobilis HER1398]